MGRFTRLVVFAFVAAAAALSTFAAKPASASETGYLKTVVLKWVEPGNLASTAKDTMFVTTKADTARSLVVDISDADWDAIYSAGSVATGYPIASVDFFVTKANDGKSDTLSFNIEREYGGPPSASCTSCKPDTLFQYNPLSGVAVNSALGSVAVAYGGGANPLNNVFHGIILEDVDGQSAVLTKHLKRFRLVTCGDSGGGKLSGVMGTITYVAKR